jgi:predicted RNase H-like HicB family nuclease
MMESDYSPEKLEEASRYEIVVIWDNNDGIFVARMPELPGVVIHADTPEEATSHAIRAGADWLAAERAFGHAVPAPKSMLLAR